MPFLTRTALAVLTAGTALAGVLQGGGGITAQEIRAHLYFLSRDELQGRAPGTPGADLAAEYIKTQFMGMGLEPLDGSYFQEVPLAGVTPDPTTLSLAFEAGENRFEAPYPAGAVIWPGEARASIQVSGEVVFVGYGIDAPVWSWDDFKGRDLSGKILVFLVGEPPAPPDEPALFDGRALTYYGRWTFKLEEARRQGASGALIVHTDDGAGYPWSVVRTSWTGEQLMLPDVGGAPVMLQGWLTRETARQAFAQAGVDLDELYVQAARRDFRPVNTGITARARINSRTRDVATRNVVAQLPGTDPELADETVVFTSHYDHLGVGPPVNGDSVYNGAYDNASGVAVLLEVAAAFAVGPGTPRRTVFLATTAEEAGLLGARYYVDHPLVPLGRTVAALNVDGANLWGETEDMIAVGLDRSSLGQVVERRAAAMDLRVLPDPEPEKGGFFRSDQLPFARAGIPVLFVRHGLTYRDRPPGWGQELMARWTAEHYHGPGDEYHPSFDLSGAVQQGQLIYSVGLEVATVPEAPGWREDDPFRP